MHRLLLLALLVLAACDSARDAPEIARYTGAPITEADATVTGEGGEPLGWSGTSIDALNGQFVTLRRAEPCGDECAGQVRFSFEGPRGAALPTTVEGIAETSNLLPEEFEVREIEIQRVEIQDWGPEVYSGVVYPITRDETAATVPYVFWTDDVAVAAD